MPVFSDANELLFQGKWNAILGILETSNLVSHSFHSVYVTVMLFVSRFLLSLSHPTLLAPRDEMDLNHDCFVCALI